MKRIVLTITALLMLTAFTNAQDYNTAIGLRGGLYNGFTIKHFIGEKAALEGIAETRWRGFNVTGLYEIHNQAFDVEGLNWYWGVGAHLGFWDGTDVTWIDDNNAYTLIGVDGIIGMEFNFPTVPINVSVDYKPAMNLIGYTGFWGDGGAASVRYYF